MKRYCTDCGSPTEYSVKKPVFCSNCGNSFEKSAQPVVQKVLMQKPTIANKIRSIQPRPEIEDDYDYNDNEDVVNVPKISNIQIETQNDEPKRGVKLKDLMGTNTNLSKKEKTKSKGKKISRKQILEDFAKEAGSLRKNKR